MHPCVQVRKESYVCACMFVHACLCARARACAYVCRGYQAARGGEWPRTSLTCRADACASRSVLAVSSACSRRASSSAAAHLRSVLLTSSCMLRRAMHEARRCVRLGEGHIGWGGLNAVAGEGLMQWQVRKGLTVRWCT